MLTPTNLELNDFLTQILLLDDQVPCVKVTSLVGNANTRMFHPLRDFKNLFPLTGVLIKLTLF